MGGLVGGWVDGWVGGWVGWVGGLPTFDDLDGLAPGGGWSRGRQVVVFSPTPGRVEDAWFSFS